MSVKMMINITKKNILLPYKKNILSSRSSRLFQAGQTVELTREGEIKSILRRVIDDASGKNLVSTGSLQGIKVDKDQGVKIDLELFVPGHPYTDKIKSDCLTAVSALPWVTNVDVNILSKKPSVITGMGSSLSHVAHVIAVSSCKGGVGKSTVAVNLASELQKRGLRVGLLDADIYGPSLPLMVEAADLSVQKSAVNPKWILPLTAVSGLKILSFGHVNPRSGAPGAGGKGPAVMRGPIATRVITQLVTATEWGNLDYLVVDMPPGTGDVQITLSQCITFTGAVIVTTPHELSLADATKGVAMFQDLRIPTLAVVENMSYFECDLGTRYHPFGEGGRQNLLNSLTYAAGIEVDPNTKKVEKKGCGSASISSSGSGSGGGDSSHGHKHDHSSHDSSTSTTNPTTTPTAIPTAVPFDVPSSTLYQRLETCPLHCIPLSRDVTRPDSSSSSSSADRYRPPTPVVIGYPESKAAIAYSSLADDVITEILKLQLEAQGVPSLSILEGRGLALRYYTATKAIEYIIPSIELRLRDPATGMLLADHKLRRSLYAGIVPVQLDFKGNYGVSIVWSDGHYADIFPFDVLRDMGEELVDKNP